MCTEGRSIVQPTRQTSFLPRVHDKARMIVDEREQVGLSEHPAERHFRTVEPVGLPQIVRQLGLEASAVDRLRVTVIQSVVGLQAVDALLRG